MTEEGEVEWNKETVPMVMKIVCSRSLLRQQDLITLLLVSSSINRTLLAARSLWQAIELREMSGAGVRLIHALSLPRYGRVKHVDLEFARDVEDSLFETIKTRFDACLKDLEVLNLNGCQKISDRGIEAVTSVCPNLKVFSMYWNVRVTDSCIKHLVGCCKKVVDLNLSGCKNISDSSLELIAANYYELESLNITRCIKVTDRGLEHILEKCSNLQNLNLYALSSLTDKSYRKISLLATLKSLDLCGAQNLSDEALACIAKCKKLVSLNLTWCVRVADSGVIAIARGCTSLEFLSLFGIVGVTDKCLEVLSETCSRSMTTLDVNGCIGIKRRTRDDLLRLFPRIKCFKVHS
ncbi:hypothetical protein MLD38_015967 [Melastoma candidum]|uniref:Uncharacterized protein n=1 Tax=Melastoma candidum TaxID=119954 RepID=A0ACB9RH50_9MYRT|nr:hypothetical protein MLD38_015967 [Melastoma candidum]